MKFKTHNEDSSIDCVGTGFLAAINTKYSILKKLFGEPMVGDEFKIDAEWIVEFEDGTIATIYNWKDGKNYNGRSGIATTRITDWHIGGYDLKSVELVTFLLEDFLYNNKAK